MTAHAVYGDAAGLNPRDTTAAGGRAANRLEDRVVVRNGGVALLLGDGAVVDGRTWSLPLRDAFEVVSRDATGSPARRLGCPRAGVVPEGVGRTIQPLPSR